MCTYMHTNTYICTLIKDTHKSEDETNTPHSLPPFLASISLFARKITWVEKVEGSCPGVLRMRAWDEPIHTQVGHAVWR